MESEFHIPKPIAFNSFKHHRDFIISVIRNTDEEKLKELIRSLNNNYIDIYTGCLTPDSICQQIIQVLQQNGIVTKEQFARWLNKTGNFRIILLSDNSKWIIRLGNDAERFVHLHPAKTGDFSVRIKGTTLKIFYLLTFKMTSEEGWPNSDRINSIRRETGLPPVKKFEAGTGIEKCREIFIDLLR